MRQPLSLGVFACALPGATATSETVAASVQQRLMPDGPVDLHGEVAPGGHTGAHCVRDAVDFCFQTVQQTRFLHKETSTGANTRSTERIFRLHAGPLRRDTI